MKKRIRHFFGRYVNGTRGVISLFLALLMVPFASVAAMLINAGRVNSAVAIFDEALCNASNSTLGTYDTFLRSRFALMAMKQDTSSGGTEYGRTSGNYTTEDLLNDVFSYYMERNTETLSNTYTATDLSAAGLYPLADTSVLLSSVLQASKITVPAKLVVDWGSLDDMISNLTKPMKMFGTIEKMVGSGTDVLTAIDKMTDKQEAAENAIKDCNKACKNYDNAYDDFCAAADAFNTLVNQILSARRQVANKQAQVDRLGSQVASLESQVEDKQKKIAEYKEDKEHDHKKEIELLEEEIEKLEKEIEEKSPGYTKAKQELQSAKNRLRSYENRFDAVRSTLLQKKSDYYDKIVALRDAVEKTCSAVVAFQDAAKSLMSKSTSLISDTISFGVEVTRENNKQRQQELQQESDEYMLQAYLAEKDGYDEYVDNYVHMKQENDSTILNLKEDERQLNNSQKIFDGALNAANGLNSDLTDFSNRDLEDKYQEIYRALDQLRLNVYDRSIPEGYQTMTYADLYYSFQNPVEKNEINRIIENMESEIASQAGWAELKSLLSFAKALFSLTVAYDPNLSVTIDESIYAPNGGLPSKIDRSRYSLSSPYQQEDEALSNYYKSILNSYGSEDVYSTEADTPSSFERMMGYIDQLIDLLQSFGSGFKLRKLRKAFELTGNVFRELCSTSFGDLASGLGYSIRNKALLVGYISYNTANRVTYSSSALTGAIFGLPSTAAASGGYVFCGAETEYILHGSMSEKENQESAFRAIWLQRMLLDLIPIFGDATIRTLASGVAAVTCGLGYLIVYGIVIVVEAAVDCIILCNGGTIPMLKSFVYLSPKGIGKLLEAVTSLTLSKEIKQSLYEDSVKQVISLEDRMERQSGGYARWDNYYPPYNDHAAQEAKRDGKFSNVFTWDYTKSLQMVMLLTRRSSTMLDRLADIIEMEAAYDASKGGATYLFNLDKSFTYLRASGSFTSDFFIRIGNDDEVSTEKRVVYNGY